MLDYFMWFWSHNIPPFSAKRGAGFQPKNNGGRIIYLGTRGGGDKNGEGISGYSVLN